MFRNPRENAGPTIETPLKPSAGRPPTPPNGIRIPQPPSTMTIKSSTKPLTPRPSSKVNSSVSARPSTKKLAPTRTPAKGNGNILNFFKKVDNPMKDDSIFLPQSSQSNDVASKQRESSAGLSDSKWEELYSDSDGESNRFNESTGSNKKRKTSDSSPVGGATTKKFSTEILDSQGAGDWLPAASEDECSPPPVDVITKPKPKPKKPRKSGPFLSDSEDDDVDDKTIQQRAVEMEKMELEAIVLGKPEHMNEMVATRPVKQDDITENRPVVPGIDWNKVMGEKRLKKIPIAQAQAKWKALQPNSPESSDHEVDVAESDEGSVYEASQHFSQPIPKLKKEETSIDEWGKFDEEAYPDDDDEFADGEEFVERRWMEEQAALEEAEKEEESEGFDENPLEQPYDEMTAACPICDASLTGISADDATRHVNGCLDGNPVPLLAPTPVKAEPKEVKLMPPEARNRFARKSAIPRPGQANPFQIGSTSAAPSSAFSKLMSGKAEDAAWASAAASETKSRGKPAYERTCPFYKIMPGFFICVDAFRYGAVQGCNGYFLSHFHSDHYIGLTSSWCHGPIYCSKVTANLVKQQLRVDPKYVIPLDFESRLEVPGTRGVAVTMIPANHCPGSSLFLFEKTIGRGNNPKIQRVLHCGDFRACPAHIAHPLLKPDVVDILTKKTKQQKIDVCYLDTTYLNPRYAFPPQEQVIKACADMCVSLKKERAEESDAWETVKRERAGAGMQKFIASSKIKAEDDSIAMSITAPSTTAAKARGRLLVVCGTYSIGKERICLGIARALDCKIYAPPSKMRICAALEDPELMSRMTPDPIEAQVHMQMLMELRPETLNDYLTSFKPHFSRVVGFRPSGWNYKPPNSRFIASPTLQTILTSSNWRSNYSMHDLAPQRGSTKEASCFGVPYSEHSSFRELTMFCMALRIEKVIPTVNIHTEASRKKMGVWIERWLMERRKGGCIKITEEKIEGQDSKDGEVRW